MMKIPIDKTWIVGILILFAPSVLFVSCSGRHEPASLYEDGSRVFALDNEDEIIDQIQFFKHSNTQGDPVGADSIFALDDKNYLRVLVSLEDSLVQIGKPLMFHLDWIGPDQQSFFIKRIDIPGDSTPTRLESSVSLAPEKREPGRYLLRIYYFRELIAEKAFTLLPAGTVNYKLAKLLRPDITFCEGKSKSGEYTGVDSVFTIGDKERVRAYVDIDNLSTLPDQLFIFNLSWMGLDGESFYTKNFEIPASDKSVSLYSSISIPPQKREPGRYALRLYLFDELIARKSFVLK